MKKSASIGGMFLHPRDRTGELRSFRFVGFSRTGHFLIACSPKRMLLAPIFVGIALGRKIFSRRALALFIWIWISAHDVFPVALLVPTHARHGLAQASALPSKALNRRFKKRRNDTPSPAIWV